MGGEGGHQHPFYKSTVACEGQWTMLTTFWEAFVLDVATYYAFTVNTEWTKDNFSGGHSSQHPFHSGKSLFPGA